MHVSQVEHPCLTRDGLRVLRGKDLFVTVQGVRNC